MRNKNKINPFEIVKTIAKLVPNEKKNLKLKKNTQI